MPPRTSSSSDLLAALSGRIWPHWIADAGAQYSTDSSQMQRFNVGARYQPAPGKVINATYRYTYRETLTNQIRQTDISAQWPFAQRLDGAGALELLAAATMAPSKRWPASNTTAAAGSCGSWRTASSPPPTQTNTTFFVQLELNGVSQLGSNPLETLRRNIGGFVRDPRNPQPLEQRGALYQ